MKVQSGSTASSGYFRRDVQGLRAVAVILVILFHARVSVPQTFEFGGGFIGVDVFFVISGFVVGGLIIRQMDNQSFLPSRFLLRRMRRLLPALAVMILFTLIVGFFILGIEKISNTAMTGIAASLFGANIFLYFNSRSYFGSEAIFNPLLHTWSLSVEQQFYIFFALVVFLVIFVSRFVPWSAKKILVTSILLIVTTSLVYSELVVTANSSLAFFSPFTRAWEFGIGFLIYVLSTKIPKDFGPRFLGLFLLLGGMGLLAYASVFFDKATSFPGFSALIPVLGASAVILAGSFRHDNVLHQMLSSRPMNWLGNLSYGWYLWHWPFISFSDHLFPQDDEIALIVSLLALAPAWLSRRWLENQNTVLVRKTEVSSPRINTLSVLVPVFIGVTLLTIESASWRILENEGSFLATIRDNERAIERSLGVSYSQDESLDIVVVGDSHAAVLLQGLSQRGQELGIRVGPPNGFKGCLMVAEPYPGRTGEVCEVWQEETLAYLENSTAETVIMHGYTTGRLTGVKRGQQVPLEILNDDGLVIESSEEALEIYRQGLFNWVERLILAGKEVVIVSSVPDFSRALPTDYAENRATLFMVLTESFPSVTEADLERIPLEVAQARNASVFEVEEFVVSQFANARLVDLSPLICSAGVCVQWNGGKLLYSDLDHITSDFAYTLADRLLSR